MFEEDAYRVATWLSFCSVTFQILVPPILSRYIPSSLQDHLSHLATWVPNPHPQPISTQPHCLFILQRIIHCPAYKLRFDFNLIN